jgi:hypothetical protein
MTAQASLAHDLHTELIAIYEEVMWLSRRPNVTASCARAWYTHIMSERVKRRMRRFTGKVSRSAAENDAATLRLEHFRRIQTTLTSLVERHRESKTSNSEEFVRVLVECERVHIVTVEENYAAMRAEGSYSKAGIELVPWRALSLKRQATLWKKMLRGKVANAEAYAPRPNVLA